MKIKPVKWNTKEKPVILGEPKKKLFFKSRIPRQYVVGKTNECESQYTVTPSRPMSESITDGLTAGQALY